MNRIKFIYFDIGGVMLHWETGMQQLAKQHSRSEEEVMKIFSKYDNDFCRGIYSEKEMWHKYHSDLNLSNARDFRFIKFFVDHFAIIEETHKLARELAKKYKIGLLTNLHPDSFAHIKRLKQVPDIRYAAIVQSCEVGYIKPEPEIYHIAKQKSGVAPHEILFIDDSPKNIEMAQKLRWHGHVFDKHNPEKSVEEIRERLMSAY